MSHTENDPSDHTDNAPESDTDMSSEGKSETNDDPDMVPAIDSAAGASASFSKKVKFNLSKFGPFKAKQSTKTLKMDQPCSHHRISSSQDGHVTIENADSGDVQVNDVYQLMATAISDDPTTYEEVLRRSDCDKWLDAMNAEMDSIYKNNVWTLVDKPPKVNVVSNKWLFVIKRKPDGAINRYKARLVARGFSQKYGFDYTETYAPVAYMTTIRTLFAFAAAKGLIMAGFDVKTAFLYGELEEKIFMQQPAGFEIDESKVCLLNRSLYGLKQSPRREILGPKRSRK